MQATAMVDMDEHEVAESDEQRYDLYDYECEWAVKSWHRLNDQTLGLIRRNDPTINNLSIQWRDLQSSVDWESSGCFIADNNQLKLLQLTGLDVNMDETMKRKFEAFCRALASNTSIGVLIIDNYGPPNMAMFSVLSPFFENNRNFRRLRIWGRRNVDSTRQLLSALEKCSSLRDIEICCSGLGGDEFAGEMLTTLSRNNNLLKLSLQESGNRLNGCIELGRLLQNPNTSLENLDLSSNSIDDAGAAVLGNALRVNTTLKTLDLGFNLITSSGWQAFFASLLNNSSLDMLYLTGSDIDDDAAIALAYVLANNTTLGMIDFSHNVSMSPVGWRSFFAILQSPKSALENLELDSCYSVVDDGWGTVLIDDDIASALAGALNNNTTLKTLGLDHFKSVSPAGWLIFSSCLQNPNSSLENLDIGHNNINEKGIIAFANALASNSNTRLNTLRLDVNPRTFTARTLAAFSNLLCNKDTINTVYSSNHTLQQLYPTDWPEDENRLPGELVSLLQFNQNSNKAERVRQKILHYFNDNQNVQELVNLEWKEVIPLAIAWTGRDDTGFSLLYKLIRRLSSLFDATVVNTSAGVKRKQINQGLRVTAEA